MTEPMTPAPDALDPPRIYLDGWCQTCERNAGTSARMWWADNPPTSCRGGCGKPATEYVRADLAADELRRATEDARVLRAALEHARCIRGGFERFVEDTGPWHALARIDGYQTVVDGLAAIDAALTPAPDALT